MTDNIADIFCKDPEKWTEGDVALAVAYLRERQLNPTAFKKTGEKKKRRKAKAKVDPGQIDLEELIAKTEDPAA